MNLRAAVAAAMIGAWCAPAFAEEALPLGLQDWHWGMQRPGHSTNTFQWRACKFYLLPQFNAAHRLTFIMLAENPPSAECANDVIDALDTQYGGKAEDNGPALQRAWCSHTTSVTAIALGAVGSNITLKPRDAKAGCP